MLKVTTTIRLEGRTADVASVEVAVERQDPTLFSKVSEAYSTNLQNLIAADSEHRFPYIPGLYLARFRAIYAGFAFPCRFARCAQKSTGFSSEQERDVHEHTHMPRFLCHIATCPWASARGFRTAGQLKKHIQTHHDPHRLPIPEFRLPRERISSGSRTGARDCFDYQDSAFDARSFDEEVDGKALPPAAPMQQHPNQTADPNIHQLQPRLRPPQPTTAQEVQLFREEVPGAQGMTDDEIRGIIMLRKIQTHQQNNQAMQVSLQSSQMQHALNQANGGYGTPNYLTADKIKLSLSKRKYQSESPQSLDQAEGSGKRQTISQAQMLRPPNREKTPQSERMTESQVQPPMVPSNGQANDEAMREASEPAPEFRPFPFTPKATGQ